MFSVKFNTEIVFLVFLKKGIIFLNLNFLYGLGQMQHREFFSGFGMF